MRTLFDEQARTPKSPPPRVVVGPAGWSYADWEGVVYPEGSARSFDRLAWIARYFDMVEVNSTFYRIPAPRSAEKWARSVAGFPSFVFSVKAWQGFTHDDSRAPGDADVAAFRAAVEPLRAESRLGAVLLQFPFFFDFSDAARERLERLRDAFAGLPLVVEVRHDSWTDDRGLAFLADRSFSIANVDMPLSRTSVRPGTLRTGPIAYVRLHGRNAAAWFSKEAGRDEKYDYLYGETEVEEWVSRIQKLRDEAERTFVVANNHFRGQAVTNALEIRARLEGRQVDVPPPLLAAYPRLERVSRRSWP